MLRNQGYPWSIPSIFFNARQTNTEALQNFGTEGGVKLRDAVGLTLGPE